MPETAAERIQRDKRLRRTYGITAVEYDARLAAQQNQCAICQRPPASRRLATEHDHKHKQIAVLCSQLQPRKGDPWRAKALYCNRSFSASELTRRAAVRNVREQLKRASVRGLCCPRCNRGLQWFGDSPELLRRAAEYLERFQNGGN